MARGRQKNPPPKGVYPPQLVGKGFDAHPENRNKKGAPKDALALREMIASMGSEEVELFIKQGRLTKKVKMTRLESILLEWFESSNSRKQELLMGYGYGKPTETIEISGLKTINVTVKKKEDDGNTNT